MKVRYRETSRCHVVNESTAPVSPKQRGYLGPVAPLREVLRQELDPATLARVSRAPKVCRSGDANGEKDVTLERLITVVMCERNAKPPEQTIPKVLQFIVHRAHASNSRWTQLGRDPGPSRDYSQREAEARLIASAAAAG